jgi:hypothetical protein
LGQLTNTKKNNDYYVIPKNIVKSYKSNSLNTKIVFQVKDNLGYILLWSSTDNDDTIFSESLNTFKINIPFSKTIKSWFSGILGWVVGIVILLLSLGVLFLIGKTGTIMRKGIEIKKAIKIAVKENPHKGLNFDNHILKLNRKSAFMIILPLLGWIIIYVCVFVLFSTKIFLLSLLGLIPVILGFFGIFFTPDLDDLF